MPRFAPRISILALALLFSCLWWAGCAAPIQTAAQDPGLPVAADTAPQPGLAVYYFPHKVKHVDFMMSEDHIVGHGTKGPYLAKLDHKFGDQNVFDSGESTLISMVIRGLIHLDEPGEYQFQANSNDGVRAFLNDRLLLNDPDVHGDRLSPVTTVTIQQPGWYPFKVLYFQHKGTATLQMFWKRPGQQQFSAIPAEAYGHRPQD